MERATLISVVIPVFDGDAFLSETIDSVLGQTCGDLELILVDDGSTDGSPEIIEAAVARDARVRSLRLDHVGVGAATNEGIAIAEGGWIARVDQDDLLVPDRFEQQLAWLRDKDLDVAGGQVEKFGDEEGALTFPGSCEAIRRELLFRPAMMQGTTLIRTDVARTEMYDTRASWDDYEFYTRIASRCRLGNMPSVLMRYRRHPGQATTVNKARMSADFRRYRMRYFYEMFPGSPAEDYLALAQVADRFPFTDLTRFERAGQWLVQLADGLDPLDRRLMAGRWMKTHQMSSALGEEGARIYHRYVTAIAPEWTRLQGESA